MLQVSALWIQMVSAIDSSQTNARYINQSNQLGFDADMLQIQLNELSWAVDKIFIMESTRTHNKVE